jgi:thiol-disulfide isomerase/thioredoxin
MRKLLLLLLVVVLAAGCAQGSLAPGFAYEDLSGEVWSLEELQGEVVVLYFWTGSCGVCVSKLPDLAVLQEQLPEDVHLLMLNANDSKGRIQNLIGDARLTVLMNAMDSFNDYAIAYVPTTVFIDKEGKVDQVHVGLLANENTLAIIENLR